MIRFNLEEAIAHPVPRQHISVRHVREFYSEWLRRTREPVEVHHGWPTLCWPSFNHGFGGARAELVTLTAESGRGKSTFAHNWLFDMLQQQRPCLLISLEDDLDSLLCERFARFVLGKPSTHVTDEDRTKFGQTLNVWPLFALDHTGLLNERWVIHVIRYAHTTYHIKFVLLDHLDYIEKSWTRGRNEAYVIGDCVRRLAGIAKSLQITILLIAHPAKLNSISEREISLDDLKGSSSIKQESASVLSLYRPNPAVDATYLRFLKIRNPTFAGNTMGKIRFTFDPRTQLLRDMTQGIEFGD